MPSLIGARLQPDWGEPNVRLIGGREETGASRLCRAARGASRLPDAGSRPFSPRSTPTNRSRPRRAWLLHRRPGRRCDTSASSPAGREVEADSRRRARAWWLGVGETSHELLAVARGWSTPEPAVSWTARWWPLWWPSSRAPTTGARFCDSSDAQLSSGPNSRCSAPAFAAKGHSYGLLPEALSANMPDAADCRSSPRSGTVDGRLRRSSGCRPQGEQITVTPRFAEGARLSQQGP